MNVSEPLKNYCTNFSDSEPAVRFGSVFLVQHELH